MSRSRSSEGFEWPVYAAVFILLGGTLAYRVLEDYQSEDAGELIAYLVLVFVILAFTAWRYLRHRGRR